MNNKKSKNLISGLILVFIWIAIMVGILFLSSCSNYVGSHCSIIDTDVDPNFDVETCIEYDNPGIFDTMYCESIGGIWHDNELCDTYQTPGCRLQNGLTICPRENEILID